MGTHNKDTKKAGKRKNFASSPYWQWVKDQNHILLVACSLKCKRRK